MTVILPRQVPDAAGAAVAAGRPDWLDVPFVFGRGWSDRVAAAVPEDPADFPPEVMAQARRVSEPMPIRVIGPQWRTRGGLSWAFYPKFTAGQAAEVFAGLGFEVIPPDLTHAGGSGGHDRRRDGEDDDLGLDDPRVPWGEGSEQGRALLAGFHIRPAEDGDGRPAFVKVAFAGPDGTVTVLVLPLTEDRVQPVFDALAGLDPAVPAAEALKPAIRANGSAILLADGALVEVTADD